MNRLSFIALWITVIVVASFMLYRVKYEVQAIKSQIAETSQEMAQERESLHVVAAEWEYLNRPERLKKLADKYLNGKNVTVDQVAEIEAIAFHKQSVAAVDSEVVSMDTDVHSIVASYRSNSAQR